MGGALTFNLTRAKYKLTESIPLVRGTVNYKAYDFKIMAIHKSDNGTNYTEIEEMPSSGYTINESKSYCENIDKVKNTNAVLKTVNGNHVISKLNRNDRCYLYFDKLAPSDKVIADLGITVKDGTPDFSKVATTDEGVYAVSDGMYGGTSYYWRGAVVNNYVTFAGKCWRIVRINGDGSMRLIYDGATCHANGTSTADSIAKASVAYNASYNQSNYVGWTYTGTSQRTTGGTSSNAKTQLESWYSTNIGNNTSYVTKIADGKYCNDRNVKSGNTWSINGNQFYYAAYARTWETYQPTLSCNSSDTYTLKVGLITADEVMYAGGKEANNNKYYLYNGQAYWTMSPFNWDGNAHVFYVLANGYLSGNINVNATGVGLRPVINLKADSKFSSGNGTQTSPYIVS